MYNEAVKAVAYPGVAQLVGHLIWVQDAGSSNLPTRTTKMADFERNQPFAIFKIENLITVLYNSIILW